MRLQPDAFVPRNPNIARVCRQRRVRVRHTDRLAPRQYGRQRSVSFATAAVKIYELLYVHKICPSAMTIVRNGT